MSTPWNKTSIGLPSRDGLYFITHQPEKTEEGKLPMSETALFSVKNKTFMATYMLTTLAGNMAITFRNVTHWMEVPPTED